jgi:signal transduction histidine kinase
MYFGVVAKYGLSSFTISKITRSFGNRKLFFLFLSTFEVYFVWLAVYLYLTSDYFLNDISNYLWAFVMIFVLVPIWAEIFAAAWSGMLSVKAISEELLVDLSNNKDPLGLNPFSTLWTKLALVNLPLLLFASALYIWAFISVILLMLLWAVSFGFVQISVHGYLSRLKSKLLGELSYSHTRWSEDSRKDGPVHVEAAEASDSFSLAFNSRFEQSLTGVRRMRIWLFSAKTTFGFVAYGIVLLVVALLSWYGLENISFGGGA